MHVIYFKIEAAKMFEGKFVPVEIRPLTYLYLRLSLFHGCTNVLVDPSRMADGPTAVGRSNMMGRSFRTQN